MSFRERFLGHRLFQTKRECEDCITFMPRESSTPKTIHVTHNRPPPGG